MTEIVEKVLPAEFRLVLAGSRWPLSENHEELCALSKAVDWELCLKSISSNRVAPLVYRALEAACVPLTAGVAAALQADVAHKNQLVMRQTAELMRLTRRLEAAGISYFVFKGLPLAIQAFGTPTLREAGDIDILVRPDAVADTERVLLEEGYRRGYPSGPMTARRLSFLINTMKGLDYVNYGKGHAIDLHWRFFRDRFFAATEQIVSGPGELVQIGGQAVRALNTDDLLLYLCLHGWTSCWIPVRWLADVGALLNRRSMENLAALRQRAAAVGMAPAWDAMLVILRRFGLWSGPDPEAAADQRAIQRFVRIYDLCLTDYLANGQKEQRPRYRVARALLLRTSWRARLELLRVDLFSADTAELIELPDSLLALDFLLHPLYWLMRKAGLFGLQPHRPF